MNVCVIYAGAHYRIIEIIVFIDIILLTGVEYVSDTSAQPYIFITDFIGWRWGCATKMQKVNQERKCIPKIN